MWQQTWELNGPSIEGGKMCSGMKGTEAPLESEVDSWAAGSRGFPVRIATTVALSMVDDGGLDELFRET